MCFLTRPFEVLQSGGQMRLFQKKGVQVNTGAFSGRKTLLVRIVVSQALVGTLLVVLLSLFMFRQFSANSIREITRSSAEGLKQSVRVFETLWDSTYRYMNKEFLTNGLMMDAQSQAQFDPVFSGEIFDQLGDMVYNSGLFHSVYLYNRNANVLFSSLGPVKTTDEFYDQGLVKLLFSGSLKITTTGNNAVAVRSMALRNGIGPYDGGVLSVLFSDNGFRSAMIFNIDLQVLQRLITSSDTGSTTRLLVLTDGGTVLADSLGKDSLKDVSAEPAFLAIDRSLPAGAAVREWDGKKRLVSWQRWHRQENIDWWFVSVADYRSLLSGVYSFQRQALIAGGLFILLSLLISFLFGQQIYRPISMLLDKIRTGQHNEAYADTAGRAPMKTDTEFEYLSRTYEMLNSNVTRLLSFETAGRGPIRRHCLLRLLHGEDVSKSELARSLPDKSWFFSSEGFRTVALRFDAAADLALRHSSDDMALLRFAVLNIADELFGAIMGVEAFEVTEEWLCLVLYVGDPAEVPTGQTGRIREVLAQIMEACRVHLALSITSGVGEEVPLAGDIQQSWQQALQSSAYRYTEGEGAILFHAELKEKYGTPYRYPAEAERELLDTLRTGDMSRLEGCFERFCHELSVFAPPEAILALTQLSIVIDRYVESYVPADNESFHTPFPAPGSYETLTALQASWSALLAVVADGLRRKRENRHDDLLSKVKGRVESMFSDSNLTVELLAEEAGLSANYLRTLYKEYYGQSISEHVSSLRFQEAKLLLRTTSMPANKIAGMVGYQSGGYFYTAFRKVTGMTPDEYRRSGGTESN